MSLRASLGIVSLPDLLGLLRAGERSGELSVVGTEAFLRLGLRDGKVVAASGWGDDELEMIRAAFSWREGEVEFRSRPTEELPAGHPDLDARMLRLLEELHPTDASGVQAPTPLDEARCRALEAFLLANAFASFACTVDATGAIDAEATGSLTPPQARRLARAVCGIIDAYPRAGLRRILVEDELGTIVGATVESGGILLVLADRSATAGAVAKAAGKLAAELPPARDASAA